MHGGCQPARYRTSNRSITEYLCGSFRDGPGEGGKEEIDDNAEYDQCIDNTDKEGGAVRRICADTCSIVLRIHVVRFNNAERDPVSC